MDAPLLNNNLDLRIDLDAAADLIVRTQRSDGDIPWFAGEKTDPWDHIESAMGLTVAGRHACARRAYGWLAARQLNDGSWYSAYCEGEPTDRTRDANMTSYIAVGAYHYLLSTGETGFIERLWPGIARAIDFAVGLQASGGEIHWAKNPDGKIDPMALLTGSSSVYMSLKCALQISRIMGRPRPDWQQALNRLGHAIRSKPHRFNMAKSRYSMDWFYPVLSGALTGLDARRRIARYWKKFVIQGHGVRCVSDQPWVTLAETSELCLALAAMGDHDRARMVFGWISDRCFDDGAYWCGYTWPDMICWPEDKITWTQAVILMAADAIYRLTPAADLFNHQFWDAAGTAVS
jgi:hypothetical protein